MIIRQATEVDVEGIAKVHVASWRTTYEGIVPASFLEGLTVESRAEIWQKGVHAHHVFIAESDQKEIIGFAVGGKERTGNYPAYLGELYAIYLLESFQGKGLGRKLFQAVVRDLKKQNYSSMLIWALAKNPACQFYEKFGGVPIDEAEIDIGGEMFKAIAFAWEKL